MLFAERRIHLGCGVSPKSHPPAPHQMWARSSFGLPVWLVPTQTERATPTLLWNCRQRNCWLLFIHGSNQPYRQQHEGLDFDAAYDKVRTPVLCFAALGRGLTPSMYDWASPTWTTTALKRWPKKHTFRSSPDIYTFIRPFFQIVYRRVCVCVFTHI